VSEKTRGPSTDSGRGRRKSLIGTVVSVKMDKTAVVSVERRYPHQLYHKIVRSTKRYKAHDAENSAVLGDTVRIVETRPLSKEKRWRIAETLVRGNVAEIAPREIGVPEEGLYHPEHPEPAPAAAAEPEVVAEPEAAAAETAAVEAEAAPEAEAEAAPAAEEAPAEEKPSDEPAAEEAAEGDEKE
jgi:small subunit ribosomal protein S17